MRGDGALAKNLIEIYFAFLHKLVEAKPDDDDDEELDEKGRELKRKKALKKKKKRRKAKMLSDTGSTKLLHMKAKVCQLFGVFCFFALLHSHCV